MFPNSVVTLSWSTLLSPSPASSSSSCPFRRHLIFHHHPISICCRLVLILIYPWICAAFSDRVAPLEKSLARFLVTLFAEVSSPSSRSKKAVLFVLPPWHMSYLVTTLDGILSAGGMLKLQTPELKVIVTARWFMSVTYFTFSTLVWVSGLRPMPARTPERGYRGCNR